MITRSQVPKAPQDLQAVIAVGERSDVVQIAAPRHLYRPAYLRNVDQGDAELVTQPLASPTGPGSAAGFRNRDGSQLARPEVINIYLGPFWGDRSFLEQFSKAVVEFGYLQPLNELGYGTGSGRYVGAVDGPKLKAGSVFGDTDARNVITALISAGTIKANVNSLFMLILPSGVTSRMDGSGAESCSTYCGYHDAFVHAGFEVAYAVMPSPVGCTGCGSGDMGDFTAVYAHELAEAATDKVPGRGWVAGDGQENGDLEAWILFGWGPPSDPKRFTVQGYYTIERGNTSGAWSGPDVL